MSARPEVLGADALSAAFPLVGSAPVDEIAAPARPAPALRRLPALLALTDVLVITTVAVATATATAASPALALGLALAAATGAVALAGRRRAALLVSQTTLDEAPAAAALVAGAALLIGGALELAGEPATIGALWAFAVAAVPALLVGRFAVRRIAAASGTAERALLIGPAPARERFRRHLAATPMGLVRLVAELDITDVGQGADERLTVEELLTHHRGERVFVMPGEDPDRAAQIARRARNLGATVTLVPRTAESVGADALVEQVGGTLVLTAASSEPTPAARAAKRALDVAGAGIGLALLSPLLALVAVAIRLDSRGPVLFRQVRVGRDGQRFEITKFRTMVSDAELLKEALREHNETFGLFKIALDPRVTRVGRILRRYSLDELPQLLNVLRGEMSLVGPRPLVCDEDELVEGWHRDRLRVRPGMTGPWQVLGSARIGLSDMVALDHQYAANWSVWTDLRILARTARFVVTRRGL